MQKTWENLGQPAKETAVKSSLSELRSKVSYRFFEDIFRGDFLDSKTKRKLYRGYHVYAIDGDQLELPASQDVLDHGYVGYPSSHGRETHYPKMYTAQVLDIVNGVVCDFGFSNEQDEVHLARKMVRKLERNSISIYDRLHCGYDTFRAHQEAGNFFIVRARVGKSCATSGRGVHLEMQSFLKSSSRNQIVLWKPARGLIRSSPEVYVRFIKIKNQKTKKDEVFVTNLFENNFSKKEIAALYRRRWDIETSFKDLTSTLKMGQWHSTKLNGILQEIFALLWLVNSVRRQMNQLGGMPSSDLMSKKYVKANFKLAVFCVLSHIGMLVQHRWQQFLAVFQGWVLRTRQVRQRNARAYPRVVKHRGREYKQANLVPRRKQIAA